MEAPLNNFAHAVRRMQEMASQTTVGLQVHQRKLTACSAELARTDQASAMLQSMGVVLQADKDSDERDGDIKVLATTSKGGHWQKKQMEEKRLAKLIHTAKVQQAYARSTLEACITRKESLVELARKSVEAIANIVPRVDETVALGILDMTVHSNSTVTGRAADSTCNEPWNPFGPELMEAVGQGTTCNDLTLFKRQMSDSTLDTTVGSGISHQDSDLSSTNPFMMSDSPEKECTRNPFNMDCAEDANTTSQPLEPPRNNHVSEEWANNPFTMDVAKAAICEHEELIPSEDAVVHPIGVTQRAKFADRNKVGSTKMPSSGPPQA